MTQLPSAQSTIVIPTVGREDGYDYLHRVAGYLVRKFDLQRTVVLVLDGSEPSIAERNRELCVRNGFRFHSYGVETHFYDRIHQGLRHVETPLVSFFSDDDFLNPEAYYAAVDFLNARPEYAIAFGRYQGFSLLPEQGLRCWDCKGEKSFEQDDPLERLFHYFMDCISVHYAVHRTELFRKAYDDVIRYVDKADYKFFEFLAAGIPVLYGKVKNLPYNYLVRQDGQSTPYEKTTMGEDIFKPEFSDRYQRFRASLMAHARHIYSQRPCPWPSQRLEDLIDLAFSAYLTNYIKPHRLQNRLIAIQRSGNPKAEAAMRVLTWQKGMRQSLKRLCQKLRHPRRLFSPPQTAPEQKQFAWFVPYLEEYNRRHPFNEPTHPS